MQLGQEGPPQLEQHVSLFPLLEPSPTGTGAAIPAGQLAPLGSGPQNPEDALETAPILNAWATTSGGNFGLGKMDANRFPLCCRESSPCHVSPPFLLRFMALAYLKS
jgi:hypothetical protein